MVALRFPRPGLALVLLVLVHLAQPGEAPPQESPPGTGAQPRSFSAHTDLVVLHVTVLDRKGQFVSGLDKGAFAVLDDAQLQSISFFNNEDTPVTVGLVIDNSGSMGPKRDEVITAGLAFAQSSNPKDEMFTVNFNENVWLGLPPEQPFATEFDVLRLALTRTTANGKTALYNAITRGLDHLKRGTRDKKVLIVVADGGDNASVTTQHQVLTRARQDNAVIYTVGLVDPREGLGGNPGVLKRIARETGGEAYFPEKIDEVAQILQRIARDIRSGYTIGYSPTVSRNGRYHAIRVVVNAPSYGPLRVRTRAGYQAAPNPSSDE